MQTTLAIRQERRKEGKCLLELNQKNEEAFPGAMTLNAFAATESPFMNTSLVNTLSPYLGEIYFTSDFDDAVKTLTGKMCFDVVFLDMGFVRSRFIEAMSKNPDIAKKHPQYFLCSSKVVSEKSLAMISTNMQTAGLVVRGAITMETPVTDIIKAVRSILPGRSCLDFFSEKVSSSMESMHKRLSLLFPKLTAKEKKTVVCTCCGYSSSEIAEMSNISEITVRTTLRNAYTKMFGNLDEIEELRVSSREK